MDIKFTPEHKVINDIFSRDIKYVIPDYQRPYSWDCIGKSDRNNQINILWEDLYNHFESESTATYFMGSIVLVSRSQLEFEIVDGQQRITSIFILFAAFKCHLKNLISSDEHIKNVINQMIQRIDDILFNNEDFGAITLEKKIRIERITDDFNFDTIFNLALSCNVFDSNLTPNATNDQKIISERYFKNRLFFQERIRENFFISNEVLISELEKLNKFIQFIKINVSLVRIHASSFDVAFQVFEILNNRGLPLSNKDLFRNFLIKEFEKIKQDRKDLKPSDKWNYLENNLEINDEFIGRWVESFKGTSQKQSAFNDIVEVYKIHFKDIFPKKKIELFYENLTKDLPKFNDIVYGRNICNEIRPNILFILNAPNLRYSLNFLLALNRKLDFSLHSNKLVLAIKSFERYILYSQYYRFSSKVIYSAIRLINNDDLSGGIEEINKEVEDIFILEKYFNSNIYDNGFAKLLLAKYIWLTQRTENDNEIAIQSLNLEKATLEHIIPQFPEKGTNWEKYFTEDQLKSQTYILGNMTLLSSKINSSVKNYDFKIKKEEYKKAGLLITKELANIDIITTEYISKRHEKIVEVLIKDLK